MNLTPMRLFDVVYQGIYCVTVIAFSDDEAWSTALLMLGVPNDDGVELFEIANPVEASECAS